MKWLKSIWVALALALTVAAGLGAAAAARTGDAGAVSRVRFGGDANETRLVLEMGRSARGRIDPAAEGAAVALTLQGVSAGAPRSGSGFGLIGAWTLADAGGSARLQLQLRDGAQVVRRFLLPPSGGETSYRYVIDVARERPAAPAAQPPAARAAAAAAAPAALRSVAPARPGRRTVVIDAGHGGRDPGALGAAARESAVTLRAAQALKARLERGGYRVVMTRSGDTYVPLERRVRIARDARADLFISLHADAGPNAEARGASVYTLSDSGADRAARRATSGGGFLDVRLPGVDRSVNQILLDLTQRATVNESSRFAGLLLTGIEDVAAVRPSGHRHAGFVVLLAPDVPAVLLEMGFMTNPEDERLLSSPAHARRLADAVADSIDRYFARATQVAAM